MRTLRKLYSIFSSLPHREKLFAVILAMVFVTSLTQYFVLRGRIDIISDEDTFIEGMVGDVHYLNPLFADYNDTDRDLTELIFSGLIRYDPVKQNFFPDLAESYSHSDDNKQITFALRPNAFWHDGVPLSAEDVLYTYRDVIQSPGFKNPILRSAFEGVTIESPDPTHIKFTLPKPNSYFISQLTVGILPKHILSELSLSDLGSSSFNKNPVGTGPYQVVKAVINQGGDSITLKAYDKYYGDKPTINSLRIVTFASESELEDEMNALNSVPKIRSSSELVPALESSEKFNVSRYSLNQFTAMYFNTQNELLNDAKVRKALSIALNKNELIGPGEKRIDTVLLENKGEDPRFTFDQAKAEALLAEAGVNKNEQGARYTNKGKKMVLPLLTLDKVGDELPAKIAAQFSKIGIEVPVTIVSEADFTAEVDRRDYALLVIKQNLGYNRDVYPLFHSSQTLKVEQPSPDISASSEANTSTDVHQSADVSTANTTAGMNFSNFKSFRTDGLTEAIRKENNPPDKQKLLQELSDILADEAPVVFFSTPEYVYATDKSIAPFPVSALDFHSDRLSILLTLPYKQQ